jgi:peptidoglycan/xylan/chitin deacetylase (PgdA/CDA1 family)
MRTRLTGLARVLPVAAVGAMALGLVAPDAAPVARAADPAAAEAPRVVRHGQRTERIVALTFDDGYGPATVRRLFGVLLRERVPATFFVNGMYVRQAPDLWRRIAAAGYPIASHTALHRDMTTLTAAEIHLDLDRTRRIVEAATGRPMLRYVRPPYGARTAATDRAAAAAGFPTIVMWDVTGADTKRRATVEQVVASAVVGRPGSIVLLHAGPRITPKALPGIIAAYRERGFRFVTVPELLGDAPPGPAATQPPLPRATPLPAPGATPTATPLPTPGATAMAPLPTPTSAPAPTPGAAPGQPAASDSPTAVPRPAGRETAWARRDETPTLIAGGTAVGLLALLLVAALAGRRRPRDGDGPG